MNDRVESTVREFAGRVQDGAEHLAGDAKNQAEGLYNQASGQAHQTAGQFRDVVKSQPFVATLIAVAVGYVLGRLTA